MASIRRFARRLGDQRGAELIEMAIVTPILLMILAGIFDFGFLFRGWEVVTNAAREGARVGVLPDYDCDPDHMHIRYGPEVTPKEVAIMIITSAVIPPVAVYHRARAA